MSTISQSDLDRIEAELFGSIIDPVSKIAPTGVPPGKPGEGSIFDTRAMTPARLMQKERDETSSWRARTEAKIDMLARAVKKLSEGIDYLQSQIGHPNNGGF